MQKLMVFIFFLGLFSSSWAQERELLQSDVVASRGGVDLTVGLMDEEVQRMPSDMRDGYFDDPALVARMIDSLLLTKQLAVEAEKQGVMPKEVKYSEGGELTRLNALANELVRRHVDGNSNADYEALAEDRYRARRKDYATEDFYVIRYLYVDATSRGMVAAKVIADAAHLRALGGGDFSALAKEYDDDGSASQELVLSGGELMQRVALRDAIAKLDRNPGITDVMEGDTGLRIAQLVEYRPSRVPSYEEVRDQIISQLKQEASLGTRTTYLRSFSLQDVKVNGDVVKNLSARYRIGSNDGAALD